MPRYSEERKAAVLKKLLPPHNRSVVSVAAVHIPAHREHPFRTNMNTYSGST